MSNNSAESEQSFATTFVVLLFFSILGILLYNYKQLMTKQELIQFIFTACVASVLIYFKGILTDDNNYTPAIFLIIFGFVYSMVNK